MLDRDSTVITCTDQIPSGTIARIQNGVTVQPAIGADDKEELAVAADATRRDAAAIQRLPSPASLSMAGEGRDMDWQFRNRTGIAQSNFQPSSETEELKKPD
jgi:hypothetical protein